MASDGQDGHDLFPIRLRDPEGLSCQPVALSGELKLAASQKA